MNKKKLTLLGLSIFMFIVMFGLVSAIDISNCGELQNITNDVTTDYSLISDIDCNGYSFTTIGGLFTGTLNGNGYTIINLTITDKMFNSVDLTGYNEFYNITFNNTIYNNGNGLTGDGGNIYMNHLTFNNVNFNCPSGIGIGGVIVDNPTYDVYLNRIFVEGDLVCNNDVGIVGYSLNNYIEISQSAFEGTINIGGAGKGGGLIGDCSDCVFNIQSSYVNADITSNVAQANSGGLVGIVGGNTGTLARSIINNSYSTGTLNCGGETRCGGFGGNWRRDIGIYNSYSKMNITNSIDRTGGFVGWYKGITPTPDTSLIIENSFTTGLISSSSGDIGGIIGDQYDTTGDSNISILQSFWVNSSNQATSCIGSSSNNDGCNVEDNLSYYYDKANLPILNWDFSTSIYSGVWVEQINNTPCLEWEEGCDYISLENATITINSPIATTYNTSLQLVNITSDGVSVWYNWNGTNITYTSPINITFNEGSNTLNVWANNSEGTETTDSVTFIIDTSGNYYCYQESANTTNQSGTDGDCNLKYTGNYGANNGNQYLRINYTKPYYVLSAKWKVQHGYIDSTVSSSYNITLSDNCFNQDIIQLRIKSEQSPIYYSQPYCFNGSDWEKIGLNHSRAGGNAGSGGNIGLMYDGLFSSLSGSGGAGCSYYSGSWVCDNSVSARGSSIYEEAMYWLVSPIPEVTSDLIFVNTSGTPKTTFDEGENFLTYLNITYNDNNSPVTDLTCSVDFENVLLEDASTDTPFTLCNAVSCDYNTYTYQVDFLPDSPSQDYFILEACHNNLAQEDIELTVDCGLTQFTHTVLASEISVCSSGYSQHVVTYSDCIAYDSFNVSLTTSGTFQQRKTVSDVKISRQYSDIVHNYSYNITSKLYEDTPPQHSHEQYEHGIYTINANCTGSQEISFSENITIANVPPTIEFTQVISPTNVIYNNPNGTVIQFENGNFTFIGNIQSALLDTYNITFTYLNGTSFYSIQETNLTEIVLISSDFFIDGTNPYYINIWVNDTFGDSANATYLFYVYDTIDPTCNFASSYPISLGTNKEFNVLCTDEQFNSLNVTCTSNSYTFGVTGLNTQSYLYNDSVNVTAYETCDYSYCDLTGNCVNGTFAFSPVSVQDSPSREFESLSQGFYWFVLLLLWGGAVIGTLTLTGRNGDTIQLLNIFQFTSGIIIGIGFMSFNFPIGFLIVMFSTGLGLGKFIEQ